MFVYLKKNLLKFSLTWQGKHLAIFKLSDLQLSPPFLFPDLLETLLDYSFIDQSFPKPDLLSPLFAVSYPVKGSLCYLPSLTKLVWSTCCLASVPSFLPHRHSLLFTQDIMSYLSPSFQTPVTLLTSGLPF